MDRNIKTSFKNVVDEYIVNRKAMFIPIAAVASFMLVGYAAADKEKPEIKSNQIDLAYGEKFDVDSIDITDNKDSRDLIEVSADTSSLNVTQLGSYKVSVTATDSGSNVATKTVQVNVVDNEGPKFESLGSNQGYTIDVPVKGSTDFASYVKANDNVDGDVTPFIEANTPLNTEVKGQQDITLKATDSSGNETVKTLKSSIDKTVENIYTLDLIENNTEILSYTKEISDGIIYIEFTDFVLQFMNCPLVFENIEDYASLDLRMLTKEEFLAATSKYTLITHQINSPIIDIQIINDKFINWCGNNIDVDIALKVIISNHVYYIVLWDNLPGEINFICTDDIMSEEKDWLRDRITGYWKAKSPNFSLFNRREVSLRERLNTI